MLLLAVSAVHGLELQVVVNYNGVMGDGGMYLRGDGLGLSWDSGVKMVSIGPDSWVYMLQYASTQVGQQLQMKPLQADNSWSIGANQLVTLPSYNSTVEIYPWFWSNAGEYSVVGSIFSPQLNNTRNVVVYTPPSYYENSLKTIKNVLVMHDGQNLFNPSTSFGGIAWLCQDTVDHLVVNGSMEEIIIVGLYNTPERIDEYTYSYDPCYSGVLDHCSPGGGEGDLYLDFIVETVKPWIEENFRVPDIQRDNFGILGSSLGGLISCYAGWTRYSVFSRTGCMSSSFWWNRRDFNNVILETYDTPTMPSKFYIDSGDCCPEPASDDHYQTLEVLNHMEDLGFVLGEDIFYYLDEGGQHSEWYWGHRFQKPMLALYPIEPLDTIPAE